MGGNQSRTRKLTVENDDPTSVIKVSDDVVQRIKNRQDSRTVPQQSFQQAPPPPVGGCNHPPSFLYEPSLTTVQLRQANLAELKKNDQYWEDRLKAQQAHHKRINSVMEAEYNKAMEEMDVGKTTNAPSKYLPPCHESKDAVMQCYKQYPNEPMRCAKVVEDFQRCVDSKRATLIASRG